MREHAAGDVSGVEPVLQEDARGIVGALARTANDVDLLVPRKLIKAGTEFIKLHPAEC